MKIWCWISKHINTSNRNSFSNGANTFTIAANLTNNAGTGSDILDTSNQSLKNIKAGTSKNITSDTNNIIINSDLIHFFNTPAINLLDTTKKIKKTWFLQLQ